MRGCIKAIVWSTMVILLGCVLVTGFTVLISCLQLYGGETGRFMYSSLGEILVVCFVAFLIVSIIVWRWKRHGR